MDFVYHKEFGIEYLSKGVVLGMMENYKLYTEYETMMAERLKNK